MTNEATTFAGSELLAGHLREYPNFPDGDIELLERDYPNQRFSCIEARRLHVRRITDTFNSKTAPSYGSAFELTQ